MAFIDFFHKAYWTDRLTNVVIEQRLIYLRNLHFQIQTPISYPYAKVTGCLCVCMFVPKDLANR